MEVAGVCGNPNCDNASRIALKKCSVCQKIEYCRKECQKEHWPTHKPNCKPVQKPVTEEETKSKAAVNVILTPVQRQVIQLFNKNNPEIPTKVPGLKLFENFFDKELHDEMVTHLDKNGKPDKEEGHFDGFEFDDWTQHETLMHKCMTEIFGKLKYLGFFLYMPNSKTYKISASIVKYEKDGFMKAHTDHKTLAGPIVYVLSFGSQAIITFRNKETKPVKEEKVLLKPNSLYIMTGDSRYNWTHEIIQHDNKYKGKSIELGKRYAIVMSTPGPANDARYSVFDVSWPQPK